MKAFFVALQFLTVLPINIASGVDKEDFGRSLAWFPFVGLLIGMVLSSSIFFFNFLPQPVIAALILAGSIIITGGIHLDGFADTCDGLYGSTTKDKRLEIMRDSHIGTMAASGMILLLILKFSILANMPEECIWKFLILMPASARWAQALACFLSKYARQDGKAKYFIEYASWREIVIGSVFILLLFIALLGIKGLALLLALFLAALIFISVIKSKVGGMTGDTIGAINEITELNALLFGLIFYRLGL